MNLHETVIVKINRQCADQYRRIDRFVIWLNSLPAAFRWALQWSGTLMAKVQVNDRIQWTTSGTDMFPEPARVRIVSDCGEYCFVDGSNTGLPVQQVTVIIPAHEAWLHDNKGALETVLAGTVQTHKEGFVECPLPEAELNIPQTEEKFTFFWHGPFSQWHRCRFTVEGVLFNCTEQYMMSAKARLFQDFNALSKIMETSDPSTQKRAGRAVRGFNEGKWNAVAKDIVYKGNYGKFTQNPTLLKKLLMTTLPLVEASPYDKIWGIGLNANDRRALNRDTWQGKNWLGEVLTRLRSDLRNRNHLS